MNITKPIPQLTSGRLLARNTIWNLVGQLLPMVVATVTIPVLIRGLGGARFGVLSIAWVVIGYFSLFDLGIGRALTKLVAEKVGFQEEHTIPLLSWMSLLLLLLLGVLGGVVTCMISPWLVRAALKIPNELQTETLLSFYLLALSIPMVTLTSGFRGILEALQRFRVLNLIRIPMSVYSFTGPLLVLPFSHSLVPVIAVLVGGRFVGLLAHVFACFHAMPALRHRFALQRSHAYPLFKLGGWITASNLVGPAIQYVDRFLIGAALSLNAVTYYTAPFDMVSRLQVVPGAISGVLFPAFAEAHSRDQSRSALLLARGLKYIFLILFPVTLVIVTLAPEILRVWLGSAFAAQSAGVLRWLAVGIFLNSLTAIPFGQLQAIGRADIDAKVLLLESPIYLLAIWLLITRLGIQGAAIAWMGRSAVEFLIFLYFSCRFLPRGNSVLKPYSVRLAAATSALYLASLPAGLVFKGAFLASALIVFIITGWRVILKPEEKQFLMGAWRGKGSAPSPIAMPARIKNDAV